MPVTPIVVVGIGGTGMKALLQLKKMIAENRPGGMEDLPALRLLCIDSDDLITPKAIPNETISLKDISLDPINEYLKLQIPGNVSYNDLDRAQSWFPKELEYYIPDLSTGCKQYKALGRLLFAWNYSRVLKLIEPLSSMVDSSLLKKLGVTQMEDPLIFVIASVCGGTGAGMFLDIAYMLSDLWKRKWNRFNTKICALVAMPSVFSDITQGTERIRSNGYASVKELDHFMNKDAYMDDELAFRADYPYVESDEVMRFHPFDRVFLFDNNNGRVSVSSSQIYEMMARYVYLMGCGELTQDYNSVDNNLNPKVRGTNRLLNKPTCYSSFGYYSVVFPIRNAVQFAAADLALDIVEQETAAGVQERDIDTLASTFLTNNGIFFSNQSPQILHSLSFYTDSTGFRVNIQDTIGSTVANIDLSNETPENYEAIVREYDTRFSNSDLAMFSSDCRKEAQTLARKLRKNLEAELLRLSDPAQNGSIGQTHLFIEELLQQMTEHCQALEHLWQQTETQIPGLKSALETQFLKLRQTASSRSIFTLINLKKNMVQLMEETRGVLENFWLARRKAVILQQAVTLYKGDASSGDAFLKTGSLDGLLREKESYRKKTAVLHWMKEQLREVLRAKNSIRDGEFYKVEFDFSRDVKPLIEKVKGQKGKEEAQKRARSAEMFGPDLDGLETLSREESLRRLLELCAEMYRPVFDQYSIEDRITSLEDMKVQVKTWLNFSRPFVVMDRVDSSKYGFTEESNSARFIAIPHAYAGRPCEQILNRCPVRSEEECDKYGKCLKRTILEALPEKTSVGHMAGRHEIHFLSLYHGFAASSLITLISDSAETYRNHILGNEKIHMFGPLKMYDIKEPMPNKRLEQLKDYFYLSFACGWTVWEAKEEVFLFRTDADMDLNLPASVSLGTDMESILNNYHSPEAETSGAVQSCFDTIEKRVAERCKTGPRELGQEVLAFLRKESVPLDDQEKRRIYKLGKDLSEGKCNSF